MQNARGVRWRLFVRVQEGTFSMEKREPQLFLKQHGISEHKTPIPPLVMRCLMNLPVCYWPAPVLASVRPSEIQSNCLQVQADRWAYGQLMSVKPTQNPSLRPIAAPGLAFTRAVEQLQYDTSNAFRWLFVNLGSDEH